MLRYEIEEKKEEISSRLYHLTVEECRKPDDDETGVQEALYWLVQRINTLTLMEKDMEIDEEGKVI